MFRIERKLYQCSDYRKIILTKFKIGGHCHVQLSSDNKPTQHNHDLRCEEGVWALDGVRDLMEWRSKRFEYARLCGHVELHF